MCIAALPAVGAGLSLAGAGAQYAQQSAAASVASKSGRQLAARNRDLARKTAASQYGSINESLSQQQIKSAYEASEIQREALGATGRVSAAAVEAGVSGNSVDALLNDFERQEGEYLTTLSLNDEFAKRQAATEREGAHIGLETRLVAATPPTVQRPDLFGSALGAFASALGTYSHLRLQQKQLEG